MKNRATDIVTMYEAGYSTTQVAKHFGIHSSYVSRLLKRFEVKARTGQVRKWDSAKAKPQKWPQWDLLNEFRKNRAALAYLAGIVDGEGCLMIYRKPDKRGMLHFRVVVKVSNTSKRLIDWLTSQLGGTVSHSYSQESSKLTVYHWNCEGPKAAMLLIELLPYLVIKSELALTLIEMQKAMRFTSTGVQLPEELKEERERLFALYQEERKVMRGR